MNDRVISDFLNWVKFSRRWYEPNERPLIQAF